MAEAWARHLGGDILEVYSAGTEKYPGPKPLTVEVMQDMGVDMSHAKSKLLESIPAKLDILITMGCGVECPFIPCSHREDWGLDDPSGGPKEGFEQTRDIIKVKIEQMIQDIRNGLY